VAFGASVLDELEGAACPTGATPNEKEKGQSGGFFDSLQMPTPPSKISTNIKHSKQPSIMPIHADR
jgi:hypothetical protein